MERLHLTRTLEDLRPRTFKKVASPVGEITLVADDKSLLALFWGKSAWLLKNAAPDKGENKILKEAIKQLNEYFEGERKTFDLPLSPEGTEFQKLAWSELTKIPYGKFISYGEQAMRIKKPKAVRAVGAANGKNPIGIIIPCHRVLGANGSLTGFAGGLESKRKLLALEGNMVYK